MNVTDSIRKSLLLLAAAVLMISGCYPRPHSYINIPSISGVLLKGGIPAAGVKVSLAHTRGDRGDYCRGSRIVDLTDKDGEFHVDPSIEMHIFTFLLNRRNTVFQLTSLCFKLPEKQQLGALIMARTDLVESFALSCDLNSAPREFKQRVVWSADKWGTCSNRE